MRIPLASANTSNSSISASNGSLALRRVCSICAWARVSGASSAMSRAVAGNAESRGTSSPWRQRAARRDRSPQRAPAPRHRDRGRPSARAGRRSPRAGPRLDHECQGERGILVGSEGRRRTEDGGDHPFQVEEIRFAPLPATPRTLGGDATEHEGEMGGFLRTLCGEDAARLEQPHGFCPGAQVIAQRLQ